MLKQVGYFANWPALNDAGYKRSGGLSFDDTLVPGNMASPLNQGKVFHCDVCNETFDVPSCIFEDEYYIAHAHGLKGVGVLTDTGMRNVKVEDVQKFSDNMAKSMQATIEDGVRPSCLFR